MLHHFWTFIFYTGYVALVATWVMFGVIAMAIQTRISSRSLPAWLTGVLALSGLIVCFYFILGTVLVMLLTRLGHLVWWVDDVLLPVNNDDTRSKLRRWIRQNHYDSADRRVMKVEPGADP